eukprot:TRINITY_DN3405_c0_g2_i4.p1 TRINITY_DN3405_c0_g2~~TRINITY_DN3405_c0_g2_i4.p1  ORF type:complete len:141 (-),score=48.41 TRINITY_DN3405_c0_g2_i4:143-541(-)
MHTIRYFVAGKNVQKNIIYVAPPGHSSLYTDHIVTGSMHWISSTPPELKEPNNLLQCEYRIRNLEEPALCAVHRYTSIATTTPTPTPTPPTTPPTPLTTLSDIMHNTQQQHQQQQLQRRKAVQSGARPNKQP